MNGTTKGLRCLLVVLLPITVFGQLAITTNSPLPDAMVNRSYSQTLAAAGGTAAVSWTASPSSVFPPGLSLTSTGVLSGTPVSATGSPFSITVQAQSGAATTSKNLLLAVRSELLIGTSALPDANQGSAYTASITATGGRLDYTWAGNGLPPGLSMNPLTGVISGTPTGSGAFNAVSISVQDASSPAFIANRVFTLTVGNPAPQSIISLPAWTVNVPYSQTLAPGPGQAPFSFTLRSGTLPSGLVLDFPSGRISGTPLAAGTFSFTVQVTDALGATSTQQIGLLINASPAIATLSIPTGSVGISYSAALEASGGTQPYLWSLAGSLPGGLTLSSSTGVISGRPLTAGTANLALQVADAAGATASRTLQLSIGGNSFSITTTSPLPEGSVNVPYVAQLEASGGSGSGFSFSAPQGGLPAGLTMASNGRISGTPAVAVTASFLAQVTDSIGTSSTKTFVLSIAQLPLTITTNSLAPASLNSAYNAAIQVSGGVGSSFVFSSTGLLPAGLQFVPTGSITGIPSQSGTFPLAVQVVDGFGGGASKQLSLTVTSSSFAITTASLPAASSGFPYSATLTAAGGTAPYAWSVASGSLPPGLTLESSSGTISGVASQIGNYSFRARVTDAAGLTADASLQIPVTGLSIQNAALPPAILSVPYSQQFTAIGGTPPLQWSVSAGALPVGLQLNGGSGLLRGTPLTVTGNPYSFTVRVSDASGAAASATYTVTVLSTLAITGSLTDAAIGVAYSQTLSASGGTAPYQWGISSGSLPQGLQLLAGVVSGTPSQAGAFPFTILITDAANATAGRSFTITVVSSNPVVIAPVNLPAGVAGVAYPNTQFYASGGSGAGYVWTLAAESSLPPGLTLSPSGILSGTPTQSGEFPFTVRATDNAGQSAQKQFSILVSPAVPPISITTNTLPNANTGQAYSVQLATAGGVPPLAWRVTASQMPAGLALNPATGLISGTVAEAGPYSFTIQVTDAIGGTAMKAFTLVVADVLSIATAQFPDAVVNTPYSFALTASGAIAPVRWSVSSGNLPSGLTLDQFMGSVSGTPAAAGSSTFSIRLQDATTATATREFTLVVREALAIASPSVLPSITQTVAYAQNLAASGGSPPYTWALVTGSLPPGITLNQASGALSGSTTASGDFAFTIQVTDSKQQTARKQFSISVRTKLTILSQSLPNATVRVLYRERLSAEGGTSPYAWALAPGVSLPIGLEIDQNGTVTGTPVVVGTYPFRVQVTDASGEVALQSVTLIVVQALTITSTGTLPGAYTGAVYSQALTATGGRPPYIWAVQSGGLPPGILLSSSGQLSGTPSVSGSYSFTARVTDSAGSFASLPATIAITPLNPPKLALSGVGALLAAGQQIRLGIALDAAYPVPLTGVLTVAFQPDSGITIDDPAVVFSSGGRTAGFTVPASSLAAQLPDGFALQTGTVAGTMTFSATLRAAGQDVIPAGTVLATSRIPKDIPVIRSARAVRSAGGLQVELIGYSSSRELTSAVFQFSPSPGSTQRMAEVTVSFADSALRWYQSEASRQYGSQFSLVQSFQIQGDAETFGSVTVLLVNAQGRSSPVTVNFQ